MNGAAPRWTTRIGTTLLCCSAVVASACAFTQGGSYSLAYRTSYGADMAPQSGSRGTVSALRYHESGGPISKFLALAITAPRLNYESKSTTTYDTDCVGNTCTTTKTTTTTSRITEDDIRRYEADVKNWDANVRPGIMAGDTGFGVTIEAASPSLGGDTTGYTMGVDIPATLGRLGPFRKTVVSFGFAGGSYQMANRSYRLLNRIDDTHLNLTTHMTTLTYSYLGFPLRVSGALTQNLAAYVHFDLNMLAALANVLDEPRSAQITRVGLSAGLWHMFASVEVSADRFRPDSLTGSAEVGFAF